MKTEYLRTAKNSYMIVKDADFEFESYELEMVLQNDLKNLVPMQVLVADGKVEYWFDVTGMKTLEQELSVADADREMIKLLLESICSVKMELEEYLLDDKDIPYTMGMIFRNRTGNRIQFCYIPGYHCGDYPGIRKLFEELMQRLNHTDQEAVRMTYGIYEICALAEPVLEDYLEILYGNANQTDAVCNANLDKNERFMISVDSQNNQRENHPNAWKKGDINWNREYLTSEQITDTKRKEAGTDKRKAESKETKEGREKQETGWRSSFLRRGKRKKHTLDMDYYGPLHITECSLCCFLIGYVCISSRADGCLHSLLYCLQIQITLYILLCSSHFFECCFGVVRHKLLCCFFDGCLIFLCDLHTVI